MTNGIPKSMALRICVYPDKDEPRVFLAHCLELDVIGSGKSVQEAMTELIELIDVQIESCKRHKARFFVPAPAHVWQKYEQARKANRRLAQELVERVLAQTKPAFGHWIPTIETALATKGVPDDYLASV